MVLYAYCIVCTLRSNLDDKCKFYSYFIRFCVHATLWMKKKYFTKYLHEFMALYV